MGRGVDDAGVVEDWHVGGPVVAGDDAWRLDRHADIPHRHRLAHMDERHSARPPIRRRRERRESCANSWPGRCATEVRSNAHGSVLRREPGHQRRFSERARRRGRFGMHQGIAARCFRRHDDRKTPSSRDGRRGEIRLPGGKSDRRFRCGRDGIPVCPRKTPVTQVRRRQRTIRQIGTTGESMHPA